MAPGVVVSRWWDIWPKQRALVLQGGFCSVGLMGCLCAFKWWGFDLVLFMGHFGSDGAHGGQGGSG